MKLLRVLSIMAIAGTIFVVSCTDDDQISPNVSQSSGDNFVPNQVLIKFKSGGAAGARVSASVLSLIGGEVVEAISTDAMKASETMRGTNTGSLLLVSTKMGTMKAIDALKGSAEIEYAEPNWIYHHYATSDDPYFSNGSLWGMSGTYGSQASVAWTANKTGSSNVYIGIIDEGYMNTHEDLAANAGVNPGEVAGNGIDDDGNGYVDDVYGWDFDGNNSSIFDGTSDDHGTHVAGTIGAMGGNGKGVAGVVWNVKLLSAKFLGRRGGTTANAIKAVDYFTDLKTSQGLNIVATNNSWGGGGFSQALQDAIGRADNAGILFIAAAGNSGTNNDATASYPSNYPNSNIIAVASITSTGALSSFSQYGATTVDLGAPGSGIWSTVPASSKGKIVSGYSSYSGTSMATPHVSGAAALYASTHPGASAAQIKAAIMSSVTPTPSLNGKCFSNGRLNVSGF